MIVTQAEARTYLGLSASAPSDADTGLLNLVIGAAQAAVEKFLGYKPEYAEATEYYPRNEREEAALPGVWDSANGRAIFKHVGIGADQLVLERIPIREIESVYVDEHGRFGTVADAFPASSLLEYGEEYYPEWERPNYCMSGILIRHNGSWPAIPGGVKITYSAGWTAGELNGEGTFDARAIKEATLEAIVRLFRERKFSQKSARAGWLAGPLTSENLGTYSYSADASAAVAAAKMASALTPREQALLQPYRHMGVIV